MTKFELSVLGLLLNLAFFGAGLSVGMWVGYQRGLLDGRIPPMFEAHEKPIR